MPSDRAGIARHFATSYTDARQKFLETAQEAGAEVTSFPSPKSGPKGEALYTDVSWVGPHDATRVLVTLSAVHGVEGFCGSGPQCAWLAHGLDSEIPEGIAMMQVHGVNPYGFAWLRRVTEENVDLNRNFVDHSKPYPANPGYDELADVICPKVWSEEIYLKTTKILDDYRIKHGAKALQCAIAGGQYSHPDGIFFGGNDHTWAYHNLKEIFQRFLSQARLIALVDYHTGLGPRGVGEAISCLPPAGEAFGYANQWLGGEVTSPYQGESLAVPLTGVNQLGFPDWLPQALICPVAVEFGTVDNRLVKKALRADNWLHHHGRIDSHQGRQIKRDIRAAFYEDADDWKEMVWERGLEVQRAMLKGLAES